MQFTAVLSLILASVTQINADVNATTDVANSLNVLQYALVLENLENYFYNTFVPTVNASSFPGYPISSGAIYNNFLLIQAHEQRHVADVKATIVSLGGTPGAACNYAFPASYTPAAFAATSRALERVGTSAYAGGIKYLTNGGVATVAASIAEIEARHASFLNTINSLTPFASPYETPMSIKAVASIAAGFISLPCAAVSAVLSANSITATFPAVVGLQASYIQGATVTFTAVTGATYCAFYNSLAAVWVPITGGTSCVIPAGTIGDQFFFLTNDNSTPVTSDTSVLGLGNTMVSAGPTASLTGGSASSPTPTSSSRILLAGAAVSIFAIGMSIL